MIKGGRKKGEKRKIERKAAEGNKRIKGSKSYYFINTLFYSKKKYAFCNYK